MLKLRRLNKQLARRSRANSKTETIDETTGEVTVTWSKRHDKAVKQVQKQHAKVYNQRNNFLHTVSKNLIDNYETIGIEKLNLRVAGSIKARGVESAGKEWGTVPYETMLQGNENRVKPKDTQVLYAGNGVKTTTLLA